jgi:hypothetical protein
MKRSQAIKLKSGTQVVWPEGANGNHRSVGVVLRPDNGTWPRILWDDGEETSLDDAAALAFVERLKEP